ncbi:MAG: hypothetical protein KAW17_02990 [Candidatus Eisenbacteria sp.]|nr:hypothetical protein [Candidatus Eisenbacteria bacterium]
MEVRRGGFQGGGRTGIFLHCTSDENGSRETSARKWTSSPEDASGARELF